MYHSMNGGNWVWMIAIVPLVLIALGAVVYAATRLGNRDSRL